MDADKRHQLRTNELAEALAKLRSFGSDPQTRWWLLGLAVVLVAYGGYRLWGSVRESELVSGWTEWAKTTALVDGDVGAAVEKLRSLAESSSNKMLSAGVRVRLAEALRQEASKNPEKREELLKESVAVLRVVIDDPSMPVAAIAAAAYSLGTSYESLREFDQAAEAYRLLADDRFKGIPLRAGAEQRLATLGDLRTPVALVPGLPPGAQAPATTAPTTRPAPVPARPTAAPTPTGTQPALPGGEGTPTAPSTRPALAPGHPPVEPASSQPTP